MDFDNSTIQLIIALISAIGIFVEIIVKWDKIYPVITSHVAYVIAEYGLIFGCYFLGKWAVIIGANIYFLLVFIDFVRRDDKSSQSIASAILAAAIGVFNFAVQFALIVKSE